MVNKDIPKKPDFSVIDIHILNFVNNYDIHPEPPGRKVVGIKISRKAAKPPGRQFAKTQDKRQVPRY